VSTLSEFILPLGFVWLVVYLQKLDPDVEIEEGSYTCPRQSPLSPVLLAPKGQEDFFMELGSQLTKPGIVTIPPLAYLVTLASKLGQVIAIAPDVADDIDKIRWIKGFQKKVDKWTAAFERPVGFWKTLSSVTKFLYGFEFCRFRHLTKIYNSKSELDAYVNSATYGSSVWPSGHCPDASKLDKPRIHLALIVNKIGTKDGIWDYTIQANMTSIPFTYPRMGYIDKIHAGVNPTYLGKYATSGFLTLQQTVDRVIVNKKMKRSGSHIQKLALRQYCDVFMPILKEFFNETKQRVIDAFDCMNWLSNVSAMLDLSPLTKPVSYIPNDARMTEFPTPAYTSRPFYDKIKAVFALDLILTFLWPISRLIRGIVHEKETKMREGMRMMGLNYSSLYLSWFLTYGFIFFVISLVIAVISQGSLFARSAASLVFGYFFLFGLSIISYCFLVSVLFNRAKTASTAGVVLFFMGFFAYFGVNSKNAGANAKLFGSILSPTAFGIGASILASYEGSGQGVTLNNWFDTPNENCISFAQVLMALIFDTVLYMFLTFYLDNVMPQEFGVSKPWNFLCTREYWGLQHDTVDEDEDGVHGEQDAGDFIELPSVDQKQLEQDNRCIKLSNISKVFPGAAGGAKVAVKGMDLTMYEGQIFVLLGHNGAGKTTTISMLTGLLPISGGSATMFGMDVSSDMSSIRHTMGVCPQHDVLFPDLTVKEHLEFFAALKLVENIDEEVSRQIEQVGLVEKKDVLSKNLSGGQKRKLSVAIALLGDSKIVFLDEPSSGLDVHARRSLWAMLQKNRVGRIIVLTTHFMDEADFLGDRIGIMADGNLRCCGTSLFLKSKYGIGYTLTFSLETKAGGNEGRGAQMEARKSLTSLVSKHVEGANVLTSVGAEVVVKMPLASSSNFPGLFAKVDQDKKGLGLAGYSLSVTTLEEVFLKVASDEYDMIHNSETSAVQRAPTRNQHNLYRRLSEEEIEEARLETETFDALYTNIPALKKFSGQFGAMFRKRFQYARRDRKTICCNVLLPVLLLVTGLALMKLFPLPPPPEILLDVSQYHQGHNYVPFNVSFGAKLPPPDFRTNAQSLPARIPTGLNNTCAPDWNPRDIPDGSNLRGLSTWLLDHQRDNATSMFGAVQYSHYDLDHSVEYTILTNSTAKHGPGVFMNLVNQDVYRVSSGNANGTIRVRSHPFAFTSGFVDILDTVASVDASMSIVIAFSFIPASVAIFIVREREISAKHQQLISGASIVTYWISSYTWDLVIYLIPWAASCITVWAFNIAAFEGDNLYALSLLFLLYGCAIIPFTYLVSFLFESHSTAQNIVLILNFITGLVLLIASFVMSVIESTKATNNTLKYLYRLFPGYTLGDGLLSLTVNYGIVKFDPDGAKSPYAWDNLGGDLTYLGISAVLFFVLTIMTDIALGFPSLRRRIQRWLCCGWTSSEYKKQGTLTTPLLSENADVDVTTERFRVDTCSGTSEDVLVVNHLRKVFGDGKVAVEDLTFGVAEGECFGFLGVNGAGKTTTMKILTGDILPTNGTAKLVGLDILTEQSSLRRRIGYCPQFDALLELLTVREHLELYARIKCIPEHLVGKVARDKIKELNLDEFADRTAGTLSGGNKRKLSVAIAMVGAPPLVFCDEPTSGVDPLNRRFLCDVLSRITSGDNGGRKGTVILTSHSMEECEALCTKVGIMVAGGFKCFGSIPRLKARYGEGLTLNIKFELPRDSDVERLLNQLDPVVSSKGSIEEKDLVAACTLLGTPSRFQHISDLDATGCIMRSMIEHTGYVDALYLAEWWLSKDFHDELELFLKENFHSALCLEKRDHNTRWKINSPDLKLGSVFKLLETQKKRLGIVEYSCGETTLEEIFVMFASQQ